MRFLGFRLCLFGGREGGTLQTLNSCGHIFEIKMCPQLEGERVLAGGPETDAAAKK